MIRTLPAGAICAFFQCDETKFGRVESCFILPGGGDNENERRTGARAFARRAGLMTRPPV
jgi:hypothetical protein